jgi:hypothetical protein
MPLLMHSTQLPALHTEPPAKLQGVPAVSGASPQVPLLQLGV